MSIHQEQLESKLMNWPEAKKQVRDWRSAGDKVVFTNGCFDILHLGHVSYLAAAAELGDRLVIGLNASESVRRLKGEGRPIQDDDSRQFLLAAMSFVDAVVLFREDTPLKLIQSLRPDLLVKGGDYKPDEVVGAEVVHAYGGQVIIIPFVEGYSTSAIAEKIKRHS